MVLNSGGRHIDVQFGIIAFKFLKGIGHFSGEPYQVYKTMVLEYAEGYSLRWTVDYMVVVQSTCAQDSKGP